MTDDDALRPAPNTPGVTVVTDPADPRLGDYAALTDAALRKRYEHQAGVLIAEGPNPVRQLLRSATPLRSVLLSAERLDTYADVVAAARTRQPPAPVYVTSREVLHAVVRFRLHQGIIACGARRALPSATEVLTGARRIVVLEGLNDHENLGALFRTARGLGVDAVLLGPGCADPLYRRSVRVSMGHVLHVPFAGPMRMATVFAALADHSAHVLALTPNPPSVELADVEVPPGRPVAVLLGAEGPGLTAAALAGAHQRVRIPLDPMVDSLNVGVAAGIALASLRG